MKGVTTSLNGRLWTPGHGGLDQSYGRLPREVKTYLATPGHGGLDRDDSWLRVKQYGADQGDSRHQVG